MSHIRTRFAPSPTGFLHIGGLRTALYSYLYAKKNKGKFILRIEDTDQTRFVKGAIENIINTLQRVGINFDEGPVIGGPHDPYIQTERLHIYSKYAQELLKKGYAYYCFCTKDRLDDLRKTQMDFKKPTKYDGKCKNLTSKEIYEKIKNNEPYVIRLKVPDNEDIVFDDLIRGKISINTKEVDDQVLIKSDGYPTYHMAVVVDDHLMEITHIIRGEEWLPSTPKHVLLYKFFGWETPAFAHIPLILNKDKSKLSKRQNDVSVESYLDRGYLPATLINFIALLGWNPGDDRELFTIDQLISEFDLKNVHKAGAVFNPEKLDWLNTQYIKDLPLEEFINEAMPYFKKENLEINDLDYFKKVCELERTRIKTLSELPKLTSYFFIDKPEYDASLLIWKKGDISEAKDRLKKINEFILNYHGNWDGESLEKNIKLFIEQNNLGTGNTLWPLRVALSGQQFSPSPFELMSVLGVMRVNARISHALNLINNQ